MFDTGILSKPFKSEAVNIFIPVFFIAALLIAEWIQRAKPHVLDITDIRSKWMRRAIYLLLVLCIIWFTGKNESFIYFQF
jgi:hypothetical protein